MRVFSKMNVLKKMKNDKRGMTLVEILVVLIIFAIIAAFSIPTMLGFVNDARDKAHIAEARTCYIAGQSIATEQSAFGVTDENIVKLIVVGNTLFDSLVGEDLTTGATVTATVTDGRVTSLTYTVDGTTVTVNPGAAVTVR